MILDGSRSRLRPPRESRKFATESVYSPEVIEPVSVAMRDKSSKLEPITLSEAYLKNAGRVAQIRAKHASLRLAAILK